MALIIFKLAVFLDDENNVVVIFYFLVSKYNVLFEMTRTNKWMKLGSWYQ